MNTLYTFHCITTVERPIPQDLLPAYLNILARLNTDDYLRVLSHFPEYDKKLHPNNPWWKGEAYRCMSYVESMIHLNIKEGMHFGQGPDDPTDIGFYTPN